MKNFLKNKITRNGNNGHHKDYLLDRSSGLYIEDYFREMLYWERRRTERSGKPFLLMLINVEKIGQNHQKKMVIQKISNVLLTVTRQTDTKGWYKDDSLIGIIFTEPCEAGTAALRDKICSSLSDELGLEVVRNIEILTYVFPEKSVEKRACGQPDLNLYPDLSEPNVYKRISGFAKRIMDIGGSILGILIFAPFFLIIPVLIKLTSKGPILFKQERIGLYGRRFTFYKFRSMRVDSDDMIHREYITKFINERQNSDNTERVGQDGIYKLKDDPRVTRIGKLLRKSSLDELPQFFNVLKGEMSLVGPRPPILYELERYDIWHRRRVLEIKPGITGLWQVKGRSSTSFDEMVRLDLKYSIEWSLWKDVKILLLTPLAILNYKGAY